MNPDFTLRFYLDRRNNDKRILLTDTSTGFSSSVISGIFKITYPDGTVIENTNHGSPDISAVGGTFNGQLKFDANDKIQQGSYTVRYTVDHSVDGNFFEEKTFTLSWTELDVDIRNDSDVALPEVKFTDPNSYSRSGFNKVVNRTMRCNFPTTSDRTGNEETSSTATVDMVYNNNYYEGIYDPSAEVDVTYTHQTDTFMSIFWQPSIYTEQFDVRKVTNRSEILGYINTFKDAQEVYKGQNTEEFNRQKDAYNYIMSIFTQFFERVDEGDVDNSQDLLEEMKELLNVSSVYVYQSGPISGAELSGRDIPKDQGDKQADLDIDSLVNIQATPSVSFAYQTMKNLTGGGIEYKYDVEITLQQNASGYAVSGIMSMNIEFGFSVSGFGTPELHLIGQVTDGTNYAIPFVTSVINNTITLTYPAAVVDTNTKTLSFTATFRLT